MPKLTCPECLAPFHSSAARRTSCPRCLATLDVRDPDRPGVLTRGKPRSETPYDDELPKLRPPVRRSTQTIVVKRHSDATPKAMLALVVMGVIGLFGVLAAVIVVIYSVSGSSRPEVARASSTTNPPATTSVRPGPVDGGGPGLAPAVGPPPPAADGLPGFDPGRTQPGGRPAPTDGLEGFLPGLFPPSTPPGPAPAAPAQLVTLSNLRVTQTASGQAQLSVEFVYAAGQQPDPLDTLVVRTATGLFEVRLDIKRMVNGTIVSRVDGATEAWMERKAAATVGADGLRISNLLQK